MIIFFNIQDTGKRKEYKMEINSEMLMYAVGALILLFLMKFFLKSIGLLISLAVLAGIAFAAYKFVWPMLQNVM